MVMPLQKALFVLADIHTREDDLIGFVVMPGCSLGTTRWSSADYIEAWESVRYNVGLPVEARTEKQTP